MKVAVLVHWNEGEDSGVFKKIVSQVHTWKIQGVQVSVHIVSREPNFDVWQRHLGDHLLTFHCYRRATRFRSWGEAIDAIFAQEPDLVYHRYDLYMPSIGNLAKRLPLVLEINTDDLKEYCLSPGFRCWYNRLTRGLLLQKVAGMVFVTHELSRLPHFAGFGKPYIVIGNGIALQDYPQLPSPNNQAPRLVFVGTGNQPWQGVDKVLQLARHFSQWHFDLIGLSPDQIKQTPPNVFVYGRLSRKEYEPILAWADIALGTLALHRKGMEEGSPLKVREYLAYGLPVIIGYKDTDFPEDAPFILRLPNSEDNIEANLSAIETFVHRWLGQRVSREAIAHLDVKVKEFQRIAFFQEVLRGFS
jgi:glycosyltransferase involved in cell wall biosynthesis